MANPEHLDILKQGIEAWNLWRAANPAVRPDLGGADLSDCYLGEANLAGADLRYAKLTFANLSSANLIGADLSNAVFPQATLIKAELRNAVLIEASCGFANFLGAKLHSANFRAATLSYANFTLAELPDVNFSDAKLEGVSFINCDLKGANLSGAKVFGTSAWNVQTDKRTTQQGLLVTEEEEPRITVDDIEVAQFIHLLLGNKKIRNIIDTAVSTNVLILGRFTPERKVVLDALRNELRRLHYVPILFDFDVPAERDITETVSLLARMARFIIADLTDPSSIPKELEAIVPHVAVPVQPIIGGGRPYAMLADYWKYHWVLTVHRYQGLESLLRELPDRVIAPAEKKMKELSEQRRRLGEQPPKPQ